MMNILETNRKKWENHEAAEQAEETHTELSDAEPEAEISEDEEPTKGSSSLTPSIIEFNPPPPKEVRRQSLAVPTLEGALGVRRHSVPVNMEPSLPRTIYRRESLPISRGAPAQSGRSTVSPVPTDSRASSGLREEDELMKFGSQSSLLSSSSGHHHSSGTCLIFI